MNGYRPKGNPSPFLGCLIRIACVCFVAWFTFSVITYFLKGCEHRYSKNPIPTSSYADDTLTVTDVSALPPDSDVCLNTPGVHDAQSVSSEEQENIPARSEETFNPSVRFSTTDGGSSVCKFYRPPSRGYQLIRHLAYTVAYDADYKTPFYVSWTLTASQANGTVPRGKHFKADPNIFGAKAYPADYKGSGYDRGHMAPAGDMKWSYEAMNESFYMSNMCPQNPNLNRGVWKDLEETTREWAKRYGAVSVAAGPIYFADLNNRKQSGKHRNTTSSTYDVPRIGANDVGVPDQFYKVVLMNKKSGPVVYAFIFNNAAGRCSLRTYQRTVDEVESITGIDFFYTLPKNVQQRIESKKSPL